MLEKNPQKGISMLIAYADKRSVAYANNENPARQHYFNAVLYGNKYNRAGLPEEKEALLGKMIALMYDIEAETAVVDDSSRSDIEKKQEELRSSFIDKGIRKDVVFECTDIYKTYPSTDFELQDIDLVCRLGEITGLVGENANGKSTLLKIMAGIITPDKGTYNYGVLDNNSTTGINWEKVKKCIAYLPQELGRLYGGVESNLRFFAAVHGLKGKMNDHELEYIIHRLGLAKWRNAKFDDLSGGAKLRFALARILLRKPRFLILDEPLANLDINTQNILLNDLRDLAKSFTNPISIILSSQHLEEVESVSDNMVILSKGKMIYNGPTSDIGSLRTENVFEIKTSLLKDELTKRMEAFAPLKIEHTGFTFMITASLDHSLKDLMQYMVDNNIPVSHVSDISNSTKKWILATSRE